METLFFRVADHTFGISFQDSEINEDWLPSFLNFKVDSTDCDLFSLVVVGEKKGAEVAGEYVTAFDVEGMKFSVFHLPKGGYRFEIHNPANEEVRCILTANADFSKGECTLCGSRMLRSFSLGNFLMMMFGFASAFKNTLLFHSSVIEKDGKGFLFLGKSGTGKSTHSRLWMEHIEGATLLNDDNPVVRMIDGKAFVFGSPWSGKTPCYKNRRVEIGGIVRLKQHPTNCIERMTGVKAYATLLPSVSNMIWDKRVNHAISDTISSLATTTNVFQLHCLPNAEAAELCHKTICS